MSLQLQRVYTHTWGPALTMGELPVEHTDRWHPTSFIPYIRCVVFYRSKSLISRAAAGATIKIRSRLPRRSVVKRRGRPDYFHKFFPTGTAAFVDRASPWMSNPKMWHCARYPIVYLSYSASIEKKGEVKSKASSPLELCLYLKISKFIHHLSSMPYMWCDYLSYCLL